jgi:hypothetical protein
MLFVASEIVIPSSFGRVPVSSKNFTYGHAYYQGKGFCTRTISHQKEEANQKDCLGQDSESFPNLKVLSLLGFCNRRRVDQITL